MLNGKAMVINLMVGLMKKTLYKMSQYLPKPYKYFGGDINVKVDLSNATKTYLKISIEIDMYNLALKSILAKLKADISTTISISISTSVSTSISACYYFHIEFSWK